MPPTADDKLPVTLTSADPNAERVAQLRKLFPECVADGQIDFDKLKAALGEAVATGPERFTFSWAGRADAANVLLTPSRATLIPKPDESVDWDATRNLFIEGDNLEVLKLLYKAYAGKVKLIYIDPPYNTGQDFVYPDDFADPLAVYLKLTKQTDDAGNLLTSNPETSGRYHSAWLSMMYPRLFLARQLLRDDGVIFVSIDDHEVHHLRLLMNEVFGEENFVATILWQKVYAPKNSAKHFSEDHDFLLVYARDGETWRPRLLPRSEEANANYSNSDNDSRGPWRADGMSARNYYASGQYEVTGPKGQKHLPPKGRYWTVSEDRFKEMDADGRIWWGADGGGAPAKKTFLNEVRQGMTPQTLWLYEDVGHTQEAKKELLEFVPYQNTDNVLDTVKPARLLRRILQLATTDEKEDIVLDFFAGSASMAHAVLTQNRDDGGNRQFIAVQFPEPLPVPEKVLKRLTDIGETRIRNVIKRLKGETGNITRETPEDLGFKVFALGESHFSQWAGVPDRDASAYAATMEHYLDPIKPDADAVAVLWELAIKEGYGLNSTITTVKVGANTVYTVTDPEKDQPQSFRACLDAQLTADIAKQLGLTATDLFICRDAALDDTLAANLALQCRLKTI